MKAVVVGAGHIAKQHLSCLHTLPNVEVAAVCDLSAAVAEATAERFGISRWYTQHSAMLADVQPNVVHITTPVTSHFAIASDALDADAHVFVEKPATAHFHEIEALMAKARSRRLILIEDYNYIFNQQVREIADLIDTGALGDLIHVDISIALQFLAPGSPFADANVPHPTRATKAGAIGDFLPHLASLAHFFIGPHRSAHSTWSKHDHSHPMPYDEFRALVVGARAPATLSISSRAQPDVFNLRVEGTRMRASANLFETCLLTERVRSLPKPLNTFVNGLSGARQMRRSALSGLWRKFSSAPNSYEGLWFLLERTYQALESGSAVPISPAQVVEVNRLVEDLVNEEYRL